MLQTTLTYPEDIEEMFPMVQGLKDVSFAINYDYDATIFKTTYFEVTKIAIDKGDLYLSSDDATIKINYCDVIRAEIFDIDSRVDIEMKVNDNMIVKVRGFRK